MPFKSKAQVRKFGAMEKSGELKGGTLKKWAKHTKSIEDLPEKVTESAKQDAFLAKMGWAKKEKKGDKKDEECKKGCKCDKCAKSEKKDKKGAPEKLKKECADIRGRSFDEMHATLLEAAGTMSFSQAGSRILPLMGSHRGGSATAAGSLYQERVKEIADKIRTLTDLIDRHETKFKGTDMSDYGHAGDLGRISELLDEAIKFIR